MKIKNLPVALGILAFASNTLNASPPDAMPTVWVRLAAIVNSASHPYVVQVGGRELHIPANQTKQFDDLGTETSEASLAVTNKETGESMIGLFQFGSAHDDACKWRGHARLTLQSAADPCSTWNRYITRSVRKASFWVTLHLANDLSQSVVELATKQKLPKSTTGPYAFYED